MDFLCGQGALRGRRVMKGGGAARTCARAASSSRCRRLQEFSLGAGLQRRDAVAPDVRWQETASTG